MTTLFQSFTVDQLQRWAWLRGVASVFDLRGQTIRQYRTYDEAELDARAIGDDWRAVGEDLRSAMGSYAR